MRAVLPALSIVAVAVALMAAAPMPAPVPSTGVAMLAADAEERWVTFDLTPGNQIRFTALIDGAPATAVLDTGVSASVVSRRYAADAKLGVQPRGSADAIGGNVSIGWTATRSIAFGGLVRRGGGIGVTTLPATATGSDRPVDMLVGHDLIDGFALDIDYAALRFRLLPSGRMPFLGESAPLRIAVDRGLYITELALGGHRLRPIVVDTGDGASVTLSHEAWTTAAVGPLPITTTIAYGLGGPQETELAIVPALAVGRLRASDVEVRIEPRGGFSQAIGAAGRIGSGFLQHFRVLLDPAAGHVVFGTSRIADLAPLKSTSGILTRTEKDRLRVLHVMRGSPAEADGWHSGEMICSIDGGAIDLDYEASGVAGWSVDVPGRAVSLGLCDGGVRHLTLRQFY